MIIYTDIITGDEIISDTFRMKEVDGVVYEIDGKMITKVIGGDVVVDIGGNPSAVEASEDMETKTETVVDVCDAFRLEETIPKHIEKKQYLSQLKGYMKRVKDALKERGASDDTVKEFQDKAQKYSAKILSRWDNYDTYTGQSQDHDGMYVLVDFREDGVTPYLTVWKHGLMEVKV